MAINRITRTQKQKVNILIIISLLLTISLFSQDKPTFYLRGLLDMWKKNSINTTANRITQYNTLIPETIRENVVYSIGVNSAWYYTKNTSDYSSFIEDNYLELCKRIDSTGIAYVVNVGETGNYENVMPPTTATFKPGVAAYYLTPAQVENIFANTSNCVGIESGENFWTYTSATVNAVLDMLRVCKKYNKIYILGEGGWGFSAFVRFFNENYTIMKNEGLGDHLVPLFKNTKPYGALVTQSSIMGAWATDLTQAYGTWNDEWAWTYSSFRNANEFPIYTKSDNNYQRIPYTHYLKSWLLTIALGGNTAFMETPSFSRSGIADANMAPYLEPFIRGLTEHNIMPSKAAVLAKMKAIANPYGLHTLSDGTKAEYVSQNLISYQTTVVPYKISNVSTYAEPFGRLYKNTYGIWNDTAYTNMGTVTDRFYSGPKNSLGKNSLLNAVVREVIPKSARYMIIPLLPHTSAMDNVPSGVDVVSLSSFSTEAELKSKFESLYPATLNDNGALAFEIDNSFFVINSHENADIDQPFSFELGSTNIETLSGNMPFQNILFGKREGTDNYWFQSNGYAVKDGNTIGQRYVCAIKNTILTFRCTAEPRLIIEDGKDSYVQKTWNPATKILQLSISHLGGAVNFRLLTASSGEVPYFVRQSGDETSWNHQAASYPGYVISIENINELKKHYKSSVYYFAKGQYVCESAHISSGIKVYGGFSGNETEPTPENRTRADIDGNGITEPWEFENATIFTGNANNNFSSGKRALSIQGNGELDGVTFQKYIVTGELGVISVGTPHSIGESNNLSRGVLRNSTIDGLKSTFQRGIVMITAGSEVASCLIQNDTVTVANSGGTVYFTTSGGILKNSVIRNCVATGSSSRGAAIHADIPANNQTLEFMIQNCLIYNNKSTISPVLRQDVYTTFGTPENTIGCQIVNCTFINNHSTAGNALIDVNAVHSPIINTIIYSEQHNPVRLLSGGIITAINCLTNKAITGQSDLSTSNVVNATLADYKFVNPFLKNHSQIDKNSPDYSELISSSYLITDNSSVAVTNKGIESRASFIPTGTANIILSKDLYNFERMPGSYTLGAFQLGTQTGFHSGIPSDKVSKRQLFPNPANDIIYINVDNDTTVEFYNITGVMVKRIKIAASENPVNIAELPAGSYLVVATFSGITESLLLVKK